MIISKAYEICGLLNLCGTTDSFARRPTGFGSLGIVWHQMALVDICGQFCGRKMPLLLAAMFRPLRQGNQFPTTGPMESPGDPSYES